MSVISNFYKLLSVIYFTVHIWLYPLGYSMGNKDQFPKGADISIGIVTSYW